MGPHEFEGKHPQKGKTPFVVKTADAIGDAVVGESSLLGGTHAILLWKSRAW